jgi:hypothetical protein
MTAGDIPAGDVDTAETERVQSTLYNPSATDRCSEPLYRFISEYDDIIGAFLFTIMMATQMDEMRNIAARALDQVKNTVKAETEYQNRAAFKRVRKYSPFFSRNLVVGMANNFFSYVSEVLQIVLQRRPEALRSSERLTNEEVLQFARIKELIAYMADKKVNELAYGGLKGVEEYVKDRLGVSMFENDDERVRLTILAELRNIHTHNRGIVNEIFLKRVGRHKYQSFNFKLDQPTHVDFDQFITLSRNAIEVAVRLDKNLAKKFRIKRTLYRRKLLDQREAKNATQPE